MSDKNLLQDMIDAVINNKEDEMNACFHQYVVNKVHNMIHPENLEVEHEIDSQEGTLK